MSEFSELISGSEVPEFASESSIVCEVTRSTLHLDFLPIPSRFYLELRRLEFDVYWEVNSS